MHKPILLARPNDFIITHMRGMIERLGSTPVSVKDLSEVDQFSGTEFDAVVISTSVGSIVKQSFQEVLSHIVVKFPDVPIFLATLTEVDIVKKWATKILRGIDVSRTFISVDEPHHSTIGNEILIIRKENLIGESQLSKTISVVTKKLAYGRDAQIEQTTP